MPQLPYVHTIIIRVVQTVLTHIKRYQWRQTEQEVIVSLLVRNVHQDKLEVEIEQREVGCLFGLALMPC